MPTRTQNRPPRTRAPKKRDPEPFVYHGTRQLAGYGDWHLFPTLAEFEATAERVREREQVSAREIADEQAREGEWDAAIRAASQASQATRKAMNGEGRAAS